MYRSLPWRFRVEHGVAPGTDSVAGCAFAMTKLKALLSITLSYHAISLPLVDCAMFVGDLEVDTCGDDERRARDESCEWMLALDRVLEDDLELSLVQNSTAVVATSSSLATALAKRLGVPVTWVGGSVRNLGTDVRSRKLRGRPCSVRRSRFCDRAVRRRKKLSRFKRRSRAERVKVLVAGIPRGSLMYIFISTVYNYIPFS